MRTATKRKLRETPKPKAKQPKLRVIEGTKGKRQPAPPRRGRPPDPNRVEPWRTVLRLHPKTAERLKKAVGKTGESLNSVLVTIINIWLDSEGS